MSNNISEQRKMRANIIVRPRSGKEIIVALLMFLVIVASVSPVINAINLPILILGMPLIMFWSILVVIAVTVVLIIAVKLEVY